MCKDLYLASKCRGKKNDNHSTSIGTKRGTSANNIDCCQPAQCGQVDMSRNFMLFVNFRHLLRDFSYQIQWIIRLNGCYKYNSPRRPFNYIVPEDRSRLLFFDNGRQRDSQTSPRHSQEKNACLSKPSKG